MKLEDHSEERRQMALAALHNKMAGEIVAQIVKVTLQSGGSFGDVMVLLESVVTGVILAMAEPGNEQAVLSHLMHGADRRIKELKLENRPAAGRA